MWSYSRVHTAGRDMLGLRCLPGERVLQRAVLVRKKLSAAEGGGWITGTLFCSLFRVAFVPQDDQKLDESSDPVLLGDHDVALSCVEKVVAVGSSRTKLVTPNCSLKFIPEELVLYCRDLRVFCFLFDRLTPDTQAVEITYAIAKTYQPSKPGTVHSLQSAAVGSIEMKQFLSNRRRDSNMNWFECVSDWEQELERTGGSGWRVSSVNKRFEMSTSLPRFIVVPQRVLDTELKKTFAHFNEGRIPRWCWRHPCGSDLLRMSSFQNNIYHEKDDIRNLELLLFGGQQLCVIVDLREEMPSPSDIQAAHSRLRTLCLGDISSSVSVPDDKWLSTLESTHWLDYSRCCLRKAAEISCFLRGDHMTVVLQEPEDRDLSCVISSLVQVMCDPHCRTVTGFQSLVQKEWITAGHKFLSRTNYHRDCDKEEAPVFPLFLDCVWQLWSQFPARFQLTEDYLQALHDSLQLPLFCSFLANSQRERCRRPQHPPQSYTPVNGLSDLSTCGPEEPLFPPVWDWALQYSGPRRARFTQPVSQPTRPPPVPVRNGNLNTDLERSSYSDGLSGSVFLLSRGSFSNPSNLLPWRSGNSGLYRKSHRRAPSSEGLSGLERLIRLCSRSDPSENLQDPSEPLLPLLIGPCVRVWRGCYLRGALHAQHPLDQLAAEVQNLREKLTQAPIRHPENQTRQQESNLNKNSNNSTFLFSSSSSQHPAVQPSIPLRSLRVTSEPLRSVQRMNSKHTFLFGHQHESQSVQRRIHSSRPPQTHTEHQTPSNTH